jgi:hypothetical protein
MSAISMTALTEYNYMDRNNLRVNIRPLIVDFALSAKNAETKGRARVNRRIPLSAGVRVQKVRAPALKKAAVMELAGFSDASRKARQFRIGAII